MSNETVNEEIDQSDDTNVYETSSRGQKVLHTSRNSISAIQGLHSEGFNVCIDVTAVDYLENPERDLFQKLAQKDFELDVNLLSHQKRERVRLRIQVPENQPTVPTFFDIFLKSEVLEREVHADLFGINFDAHPDMTRILMPEIGKDIRYEKIMTLGKYQFNSKKRHIHHDRSSNGQRRN